MSAERTHHDYSPSSLQSLECCPCYQGRDSQHARAIAGTIAHTVTETRQDDNRLDDDDAEAAAECLDFYEGRKQLIVEDRRQAVLRLTAELWGSNTSKGWVTKGSDAGAEAEQRTPSLMELTETYLPVDDLTFNDDYINPLNGKEVKETVQATTAGYIDRALISHDRTYAELFDWKMGAWHVTKAENNLQGISYALGLMKAYPALQKIRFFFKMPHLDYITDAVVTRENIAELYLRVQTVVARAREARHKGDFSTANPSVPVCNFCSLIGVCTKVAELVCKVGSKFYPLEIPSDITPSAIHTARDTTLGMRLASVVAIWAEAFRRQTADRVLRGDADVPAGFEISSFQKRKIADPVKFKAASLRYVSEEQYNGLLDPPGFGAIEGLIKDKAIRGQKKAAIQSFKAELESSGAVVKGPSYSFLKAVSSIDEND